ncbi:MAG: pilus assembly protein TadG-related protein [Acidimicrobiia bacterium]
MSHLGQPARERGAVTLWLLGLCVMLFALGGISVDLWRSFSARRALASGADAAALAGASAIDEGRYRKSEVIALVPAIAEHRARASLAGQPDQAARRGADVLATEESVTVIVRGRVGFTLLGLFGHGDFDVEVVATAIPRRSL